MGSDFNVENWPSQLVPCLKSTPFGVIFWRMRQFSTIGRVIFSTNFPLKNERAGHLSMGVYLQHYTSVKVLLLHVPIIPTSEQILSKQSRSLFDGDNYLSLYRRKFFIFFNPPSNRLNIDFGELSPDEITQSSTKVICSVCQSKIE